MSNYTTQTAALKAVTIDTAKLDAKQIDTKKLFINGELFDPSNLSSGSDYKDYMYIISMDNGEIAASIKIPMNFEDGGEDEENVAYIQRITDEGFLGTSDVVFFLCLPCQAESVFSTYKFVFLEENLGDRMKTVLLEEYPNASNIGMFALYHEGDDLEKLYGGTLINGVIYVISREFTSATSSTYSLRKTNLFNSLREKFEQMRQQNLDNSAV